MILDTGEEILSKVERHIDAIKSLEIELPHVISNLALIRKTEIVKLYFRVHYFDSTRIEVWNTIVDFHNLSESYARVLSNLKNIIETEGAYITF